MSDRLGEAAGNVGGSVAGAAAALGPNVDLAAAAASGSVMTDVSIGVDAASTAAFAPAKQ